MKNQSRNILLCLGCAYMGLAIASITTVIPTKAVNCLALGAVLFSIAELIQSLADREKQSLSAKDLVLNENSIKVAGEHLMRILKSRVIVKRGKTFYAVLLLYSLAFTSIISWPFLKGFEFLNSERFGVFCTILSFGIILISRYFSESFVEVENNNELLDALGLYFDSVTSVVKSGLESLEQSDSSPKKSLVNDDCVESKKKPEKKIADKKNKTHRRLKKKR